MKASILSLAALSLGGVFAAPQLNTQGGNKFAEGQPIGNGKGAPIVGK